ncbi:MAG: tRNA (guanosine(37)-N1)-methyltransferase TrmD [Chlorobiota bacterium]|nr:tRNA (guanosine(37)-N1)-methyltransferase TrmD [Chlorobiota bacterium]QQS66273.1 MAG: tRNA (guanosine(37)-N1)-methyltransferase TrmD [Chlorobiota bacterium]
MRIDIISAVPQIFDSFLSTSIPKRAIDKGAVEIIIHNLHNYGVGKYKQIDDTPCGGGAGMILKPEPIFDCIESLKLEREYDEVIFMTPDGEQLNQSYSNKLSLLNNLIILCGHYKGIDNRVRETLITKELSIGDYVLSGGEIPAMALSDSVIRLLPKVISDIDSALTDSFQDGLLEAPQYTKPAEFRGLNVPEVLLNGDHKKISEWRLNQSLDRTKERRLDLYDKF